MWGDEEDDMGDEICCVCVVYDISSCGECSREIGELSEIERDNRVEEMNWGKWSI